MRRLALALLALGFVLIGIVFLLIAAYQGLAIIAPPAVAALGVAAFALGTGGAIIAILLLNGSPRGRPSSAAYAPAASQLGGSLLQVAKLQIFTRFLRARPLAIVGAAAIAAALAAWGTSAGGRDEES
jgi:hypothetical protein